MDTDENNKVLSDQVNLQNKKKKITRGKLLQTVNRKYTSTAPGVSINVKQGTSKRSRHLGGISRGYLDSGTISNTMRLYNKNNSNEGTSISPYAIKRNRSKKIGNYQRKALNRLTGLGNKKKLRDLALMFSDDDGDVEDEGNNDNFEDFFRDNSREAEDDIEMMNEDDDIENSVENSMEQDHTNHFQNSHLTNDHDLFVAAKSNVIDSNISFNKEQGQLPTLASLQFNKIDDTEASKVTKYSNGEKKADQNMSNHNEEAKFDQSDMGFVNSSTMKRDVSGNKGIMSNDGEEDYDDDEFGYDGDEDFEGDNAVGFSKKDIRRRKHLESDFDDQFLMPPGSHSIDNLITDANKRYDGMVSNKNKLSESPDLNVGLTVGKRRRRSSNFQDVPTRSGMLASFSSTITTQPEMKKVKISSNTPEDIEAEIEYEHGNIELVNSSLNTVPSKKLKRKHLKPPKIVLDPNYSKPLTIKDIRDLVIYSLDKNEKNRPVWCKVENRMNIDKVVVLQIPGVQPKDLSYKGVCLKSFDELLNDKNKVLKTTESFFDNDNTLTLSSKAPGNSSFVFSAYSAFTNVPLTKQKQANVIKKLSKKKAALEEMILTLDEMIELKYPIHPDVSKTDADLANKINSLNFQTPDSNLWVQTYAKNIEEPYTSRAYALDCEMCLTKLGHELTRISVVGFDGALIYDKLVKPENEIVDYLTRFSGITESMMENIDYKLPQVQNDLLLLFDSRDILIGHSLQSDFKVMKFRHPNIIDTAVIYEHIKGPPFKPALKKLSSVFLGKEIQNDEIAGHDPSIDARTCVELVNLKLKKGLQTGLNLNSETIFKKLEDSSNIRSLIFNKFGPDESFTKLNEESKLRCLSFKDDSDIVRLILKNMDDCSLFVGKLNSLETARYFSNKTSLSSIENAESSSLDPQSVDSMKEDQAIKTLNNVLKELTDNLARNTMLVLFSGSGDLRLYKDITAEINSIHIPEKRRLESLRRKDELKQAVEQARDSIVTIYIKK
ncbi:hypothetical protein QEN19_002469 [Hanseniaspora menglaensis]